MEESVVQIAVGLLELAAVTDPLQVRSVLRVTGIFFSCRQRFQDLGYECGYDLATRCLHWSVHILLQLLEDAVEQALQLLQPIFSAEHYTWVYYFVGASLALNFELEERRSAGVALLEKAMTSDNPMVTLDASTCLFDIYNVPKSKFECSRIRVDAVKRTGRLDLLVDALFERGMILLRHGEHLQASEVERELGQLSIDHDPLLQGMAAKLSATIAYGQNNFRESIRLNKKVLDLLKQVPAFYSWEAYFTAFAHDISKISPSRTETTVTCIQLALNEMIRSHCNLKEIEEATAAAEELEAFLPKLFNRKADWERLRYLDCLSYVTQHRYMLSKDVEEEKRILEEAEPLAAEMLMLSDQADERTHYIRGLILAIFITVVYNKRDNGLLAFYLGKEDFGHWQVVESLNAEVERLALLHNVGSLEFTAISGFLHFKGQNMDMTVEKLLNFSRNFIQEYYKFGDESSQGRISYHDIWKVSFRTLQVAYLKSSPCRGDLALVWAERERARDSNLLLSGISQDTMEFDLDDGRAVRELFSIAVEAGTNTVFLIYTALIGNRGLCAYLLHCNGMTAHYINLQRPAYLARFVEETTRHILSGDSLDFSDLMVWYSLLIMPFENKLEAIKPNHLVIVPAEELSRLPFAALMKNENEPFLIEKYAISYIPSVRMYRHCVKVQDETPGISRRYGLVLGNPQGSKLPHAEKEAAYVKKVLENAAFDDVKLLQDEGATKEALMQAMPTSSWLHFAGHAHVSSIFPHGMLLLANPFEEQPTEANVQRSIEDELERYLLLSPPSSRLTGDDILQMCSSKAKLHAKAVVLSACSSGRGEICSEGVLGLNRSFHLAGAQSVVSSLWTVRDDSTDFLMEELYKSLSKGNGMELAFALQAAMVGMINDENGDGYSIKHWAPFIISGNPHVKLS